MEQLAHRFLVAAHHRRDLGDPLATSAGQHHLAATHQHAIRRAQTGFQGRALLVGERTDKDGSSHTSQHTPFRPTFTEIALGGLQALDELELPHGSELVSRAKGGTEGGTEEGRGFYQNLPFVAQDLVLAPQPTQAPQAPQLG